jgi:hypothetical protein
MLVASNRTWFSRFSDVSLLCERTGVTHLPVSTLKSTTEKNESVPDRSSRRVSTSTRRGGSVRARNLYKVGLDWLFLLEDADYSSIVCQSSRMALETEDG